jgi:hypothetical protein
VIDTELADVGEGGIRCVVPSADAPAEGDVLEAQIQLRDGPLTVDAQVMRTIPNGDDVQLGLQFHSLAPDAHRRLVDFVKDLTRGVKSPATT